MPAATLNHLVVVIPGIGGSELIDPARTGDERRVWYSGLGSITRAVLQPDRLHIDRRLVATGLLKDFTVVPLFKSIDGYDKTWSTVTATFSNVPTDLGDPESVNLAAQIVAFPYDFRLSVDHAARELADALTPRIKRLGDQTTVVLVGHSMGGLVARRWAAHYDKAGRCRGIITLGTPFRGAPKALDVLANGLRWGAGLVHRRKLSAVVQEWPGLHDLVPIDDRLTDASGAGRAAWEIKELPHFDDISVAYNRHVETRSWWADLSLPRPAQLTVSGWGHGTASTVTWDGHRVRVAKTCLPGERDGDGTVPAFSAVPPELSGGAATSVVQPSGDTHGAIGHTARLREYLLLLNSGDPPPTRGASDPNFLGFDVDPMAEPGDLVVGSLRFGGERLPGDAEPVVHALFHPASGPDQVPTVKLDDDGRFAVRLPAEVDGVLELRARVDLPDGRRRSEERVVVLGAQE